MFFRNFISFVSRVSLLESRALHGSNEKKNLALPRSEILYFVQHFHCYGIAVRCGRVRWRIERRYPEILINSLVHFADLSCPLHRPPMRRCCRMLFFAQLHRGELEAFTYIYTCEMFFFFSLSHFCSVNSTDKKKLYACHCRSFHAALHVVQ